MIAGVSGADVALSFPYAQQFNSAGLVYDLPPKLIAAIAKRETLSVMPPADALLCISGDGGHGLMQLTSSWPEDWQNPASNVNYACKVFIRPAMQYWHGLENFSGDDLIRLVAATYNTGLKNAIAGHEAGNVDLYTTDNYAEGVLAFFKGL